LAVAFLPLAVVAILCLTLPPVGALIARQPLGQFLHLPLGSRGWDPLPAKPDLAAAGLVLSAVATILWLTRSRNPAHRQPGRPGTWPRWTWGGPALLITAPALGGLWGGRPAASLALAGLILMMNFRGSGRLALRQRA
jgi:hypothetical protein